VPLTLAAPARWQGPASAPVKHRRPPTRLQGTRNPRPAADPRAVCTANPERETVGSRSESGHPRVWHRILETAGPRDALQRPPEKELGPNLPDTVTPRRAHRRRRRHLGPFKHLRPLPVRKDTTGQKFFSGPGDFDIFCTGERCRMFVLPPSVNASGYGIEWRKDKSLKIKSPPNPAGTVWDRTLRGNTAQ